jgi:NAD(P)-dependent dehydrogenase (short-subunit alcohol dehydrogenase family)
MAKGHQDKVAVITGGASGIGQAFAKRLAEDGVHIAIADIADPGATVTMVEQAGRRALACRCDVSNESAVAAMANEVQKTFGRCDIVVNCAGIFPLLEFDKMTFADWRRMLSINLDSVFLVTAAFLPGMKQRGWGRIVSMSSSTVGSVTHGYVHYVTTKAGIIGFTRALAGEVGSFGITVNAIAPTLTRSPGATGRGPRKGFASIEQEFEAMAQTQAIKRAQVPEDLTGTISWLTSDDAAFLTGQTISVNGGKCFL